MKYNKSLLLLIVVVLVSSCVSTKKYEAMEANKTKLADELAKAKNELRDVKKDRDKVNGQYNTSFSAQNKLQTENDLLTKQFAQVNKEYKDLEKKYNDLLTQSQLQMTNASDANKKLNEALTQKELELEAKAKELALLETNLNASKSKLTSAQGKLDEASKAIAEREKRLNEMEGILKKQEAKTNALRATISKALLGFKESDLTIEQKNGKVYVSLSQNLLFASGSTKIDRKGVPAIQKLSEVLKTNADIDIMVEGHTDNVRFGGRNGMKDNWDLSVMRATSFVRELVKNGVNAQQIIASGRGEFFPVADNSTRDGRAKNRRLEIILSPKLDELFNLINE